MKKLLLISIMLVGAFTSNVNANSLKEQPTVEVKEISNDSSASTYRYINQWVSSGGNLYYYDEYGFLAKGNKRIGDMFYNFDQNGVHQGFSNGWIKLQYNDYYTYYCENGRLVNGWRIMNGNTYFFTNSLAADGLTYIENEAYYFKDLVLRTGIIDTGHGVFFYADSNGKIIGNYEGWVKKDNGEWAYSVYGFAVNGWKSIDGLQYFFENDEMVHDWWLDESTGAWYFFNGGVMQRSNITINGINYKFDTYGVWKGYSPRWVWENNNYYYKDEWNRNVTGWKAIDGLQYKFRDDGTMIRDWYLDTNTQTWYFFNGGVMQRSNIIINGKLNIFDNNGIWRGTR